MCGIAGFLGGPTRRSAEAKQILERMNTVLRHRGPDHSAIWLDPEAGIGFAHDRLKILDLSESGNQPMHSHSGRYVLTYNGEIYNHAELRERAQETRWRGTSDTEALLQAIECLGVRPALELARGMFAFGLWDRQERTLTLARDRMGEKPLYYGRSGDAMLFASELKAIAQYPGFKGEIDRQSLMLFLRFGYIPAPFSIYCGMSKVPAGSIVTIRQDAEPVVESYWSGLETASGCAANPLNGSEEEMADQLEHALTQAVSEQMLADVPVGAFLSGGVDSSTIVALMQQLSSRPVKTFTIGFHERGYNEADNALEVARHLGTDHSELYVTAEAARSVIPRLPEMYDEPFADSSHIPTYLVSALAREKIKVALSGDGGDEIFGGYNRHLITAEVWNRVSKVPLWLRRAAGAGLSGVPRPLWSAFGVTGHAFLPRSMRLGDFADVMQRGIPLLSSRTTAELYRGIVSLWQDPADVVIGAQSCQDRESPGDVVVPHLSAPEEMMALDMVRYLPDDILVKVDRAAMSVSLETRMPYLDQRVVELAWRMPMSSKLDHGRTKSVLRRLLHRHVPPSLVERPKMGFGVPISEWLRGPLRSWAEALLDPELLRAQGYFNVPVVQQVWRNHLSGAIDEKNRLWVLLMFQCWLEAQEREVAAQ